MLTGRVAAQPTPPVESPSPVATVSAAPATSTRDRSRPISPAIAARLTDQLPKFTPPKTPAPTAAKPPILASPASDTPANPVAAVDSVTPRNTIIRLPAYVVQEEKPVAFKEREILTPKGRLALALKRYPGARIGSLPFLSNDGMALALLEEDYRLERKAEMEELASLLTTPTDRTKAKTEVQKTFLRSGPSGYGGMAPK